MQAGMHPYFPKIAAAKGKMPKTTGGRGERNYLQGRGDIRSLEQVKNVTGKKLLPPLTVVGVVFLT